MLLKEKRRIQKRKKNCVGLPKASDCCAVIFTQRHQHAACECFIKRALATTAATATTAKNMLLSKSQAVRTEAAPSASRSPSASAKTSPTRAGPTRVPITASAYTRVGYFSVETSAPSPGGRPTSARPTSSRPISGRPSHSRSLGTKKTSRGQLLPEISPTVTASRRTTSGGGSSSSSSGEHSSSNNAENRVGRLEQEQQPESASTGTWARNSRVSATAHAAANSASRRQQRRKKRGRKKLKMTTVVGRDDQWAYGSRHARHQSSAAMTRVTQFSTTTKGKHRPTKSLGSFFGSIHGESLDHAESEEDKAQRLLDKTIARIKKETVLLRSRGFRGPDVLEGVLSRASTAMAANSQLSGTFQSHPVVEQARVVLQQAADKLRENTTAQRRAEEDAARAEEREKATAERKHQQVQKLLADKKEKEDEAAEEARKAALAAAAQAAKQSDAAARPRDVAEAEAGPAATPSKGRRKKSAKHRPRFEFTSADQEILRQLERLRKVLLLPDLPDVVDSLRELRTVSATLQPRLEASVPSLDGAVDNGVTPPPPSTTDEAAKHVAQEAVALRDEMHRYLAKQLASQVVALLPRVGVSMKAKNFVALARDVLRFSREVDLDDPALHDLPEGHSLRRGLAVLRHTDTTVKQVFVADSRLNLAARKVQRVYRNWLQGEGRLARYESAMRIQAIVRAKQQKNEVVRLKREANYIEDIFKGRSARVIQALARRKKSMASLQAARRAANRLQTIFRGHHARQQQKRRWAAFVKTLMPEQWDMEPTTDLGLALERFYAHFNPRKRHQSQGIAKRLLAKEQALATGAEKGSVVAEMMAYCKEEFGASPSYIGPGGLSAAEVPIMQFRAKRAKQIASQKLLMQEMVREVARQRTDLFHAETKFSSSKAERAVQKQQRGDAQVRGTKAAADALVRMSDIEDFVEEDDATTAGGASSYAGDDDDETHDDDHVGHLPLSDWLFAVSSGSVRVEDTQISGGVATPKSLAKLDGDLRQMDKATKFGEAGDAFFGSRRSESFIGRSKLAVSKAKLVRVGLLAKVRERLQEALDQVTGSPVRSPEEADVLIDTLLGAVVKAESKKLPRKQEPLASALRKLLELYVASWGLHRDRLAGTCSEVRALLNKSQAMPKEDRMSHFEQLQHFRRELNGRIVQVKSADAKARAHAAKLEASALSTGTPLDPAASLSLTDEAQRLVAKIDRCIQLESLMQARETLHRIVEEVLGGGALTFGGWSAEVQAKLKTAIADAKEQGLDEDHDDSLKSRLLLCALRTLEGRHTLASITNQARTSRNLTPLQDAVKAVQNADDVLLQALHEFEMDAMNGSPRSAAKASATPPGSPGHSRTPSVSYKDRARVKKLVQAYKQDDAVKAVDAEAQAVLNDIRLDGLKLQLQTCVAALDTVIV